ncbi:MAG: NAD-dependent epimerase/dehydratase family protein [Candidatus Magasanikbacteria bacterium]
MRNIIIEEDLKFITDANLPWDKLAGSTILISGANGFLPSYIVGALLYLNEKKLFSKLKVIALVRNKDKALKRFAHYKDREDLKIIVQDVCVPLSLPDDNIDYVIHAASQASPKYYYTDPVGTFLPNVLGTYNLLAEGALKKIKNFLFFSSSEIYGTMGDGGSLIKENDVGKIDPAKIRSCYAEGKRAGETLCLSWFQQYALPVNIIRPFHTYGPGFALDDGRVFADFVSDVIDNRDLVLKSDGKNVRAFCYVADFVVGALSVLLKGQAGEVYNLGNPRAALSIRDLANLIVGLYPEKKLKVVVKIREQNDYYLASEFNISCPSIEKIKQLGWEPVFDIKTGFKRTIESFLS